MHVMPGPRWKALLIMRTCLIGFFEENAGKLFRGVQEISRRSTSEQRAAHNARYARPTLESSCDNDHGMKRWHHLGDLKEIFQFQKSLIFILGGYVWNVIFSIIFQFWMTIDIKERYMHTEWFGVEMLWSFLWSQYQLFCICVLFCFGSRKIWCSPVADKVGTASHSTFHLHVPRPPCGSPLSHTNTTARKI